MHMILIFPSEVVTQRREEACRRLRGLLTGELPDGSVIVVEPTVTDQKTHIRVLVDTAPDDLVAQLLRSAANVLVDMFGASYTVTLRTFVENGPCLSYTRSSVQTR